MTDVGYTDPRELRRNDGPDTSEMASLMVDSRAQEAHVLRIMDEFGVRGCILDNLRAEIEKDSSVPAYNAHTRRTKLHQKGLILDTGTRWKGKSGRNQAVYVTMDAIASQPNGMELLQMIKNHPLANNPFLHKGEDNPQGIDLHSIPPMTEEEAEALYAGRQPPPRAPTWEYVKYLEKKLEWAYKRGMSDAESRIANRHHDMGQ